MEGRKDDYVKNRWDLVQPLALQEYARVLTYGSKKYEPDNWRKVPDGRPRYFAALLRHVWSWWLGERLDPESGCHHLGHAMCCVAFLLEPELEDPNVVTVKPRTGSSIVSVTVNHKEAPRGARKI